jgi:hypothetical protein
MQSVTRSTWLSFLVLAAMGCSAKPPAVVTGAEICDNGKDDNGDGKKDCLDPKCFSTAKCANASAEDCTNRSDDDRDGLPDCEDSDCDGLQCGSGCLCINGIPTTASVGGGSSGTGGGSSSIGGGSSGTGGGSSSTGGGTSSAGGGTSSTGGGSSSTGGGTSSTGGGSSSTGGGSSSTGGGSPGTGGGSPGTGGGSASTGGGTSSTGGGGAPIIERACADNLDNDLDNLTDCDDADCTGITCGMGCTCALRRRVETSCSDGLDNDGDTLRDCLDPDCVGAGTELCDDGVDNTCDRAIDCADLLCTGNGACGAVPDGQPCRLSTQCASGLCRTELIDGVPNGMCTNATACNTTTNAGCNGGRCVLIGGAPTCQAACTGTGLGATGRCRPGFVCVDPDSNLNNNNNTCRPLCSADSECSGGGPGYGCNPWSKRCQSLNRGLLRYGAACATDSQCEGGLCLTGASFPNGYCSGSCRGDSRACAIDGYCNFDVSYGDNLGFCYQSCTGAAGTVASCRPTDNQKCWPLVLGGPTVCICIGVGGPCAIGGNSDCCGGFCQFGVCR